MYKQNNRFSRRSEGSIARNTMGNRIGKPLAGGKFHASRKSDVRKDDELDEKKAKAEKPVVRKILSFDDIKTQVAAWMENDRIPGKLQAWFTADATPENSDWRIIKEYHGAQENLVIDAPSRDSEARLGTAPQGTFAHLQKGFAPNLVPRHRRRPLCTPRTSERQG